MKFVILSVVVMLVFVGAAVWAPIPPKARLLPAFGAAVMLANAVFYAAMEIRDRRRARS